MPHSPASRKRKVLSDEEVSAKRSHTTTEDEDSGVEDDEKEIDEDENEDEDEPTASKTVRVGKMDVDDDDLGGYGDDEGEHFIIVYLIYSLTYIRS